MRKILLLIVLVIIGIPVVLLGLTGMVPGVSTLLGANRPRDLGTKYSQADLSSIHAKSQVVYDTLTSEVPTESRKFSGRREVVADFSAAEISATINNQPWKYWPYRDVQVKFNADGSGEISGVLLKAKVANYAAAIGIPKEAVDFAVKFLPSDPVFYVKGKAALENNKVSVFEPEKFEVGRIPLPVGIFLAFERIGVREVYALDVGGMVDELGKVSDKRGLIIGYINGRLSSAFGDFYAKRAYFKENSVSFEGSLSERISYSP